MELKTAIAKRKSTRSYSPEPVSSDAIDAILAAGAAAPVGMGDRDRMHLTVVQDKELLELISIAAAKARGSNDDPLYAAPLLILVSTNPTGKENMDAVNAACITENMLLAAEGLGIGSVIIWSSSLGIAADADLAADLGIPEGFIPVLGSVFGIPAEENDEAKDLNNIAISVNRV